MALIDSSSANVAMVIVPYMRALGITFVGFFVSAERKTALSQPKNVSAMKNMVRTILKVGKTKNGVKLAGFSFTSPEKIKAVTVPMVTKAKETSMTVDVCIPLYAMALNIIMSANAMGM